MAQPLSETTVITILSTSGRPTLITGSSIQMPIQIQSSIATVPVNVVGGSISVGTVSVVVDVATVSDILTGTIATVQSVGGTVSVDVVGGTASVNVLGTPPVSITGTPSVTVQGIATVSQQAVSYSYQQTGLATIKATAGTLYEAILTGEAGLTAAAGTVVLLNGTGTIAVLAVPSGDMRQARFGPGVSFGTLIASIIGTVDLTVVYM